MVIMYDLSDHSQTRLSELRESGSLFGQSGAARREKTLVGSDDQTAVRMPKTSPSE